jgi:hypothetical protein
MPQIVPGLTLYPKGTDFLRDVYREAPELKELLDGIGYHPYQYPKAAPESETKAQRVQRLGSLETQTRALQETVTTAGAATPLWNTENGWPTNPGVPTTDADIARLYSLEPMVVALGRLTLGDEEFQKVVESLRGVSEADQARFLVRSVLIAQALGVPRTFLYTLDDDARFEPEINQEGAFGIFRVDGTEKPAAAALRTLLNRFGNLQYADDVTGKLRLSEPDRVMAFRDGAKVALAFWRWSGDAGAVSISRLPWPATLIGPTGEAMSSAPEGGTLSVPLGPDVMWLTNAR